jgi:hypothetical protein
MRKCSLFVLDVVAARIDPAQKDPGTIRHCGCGGFVVDGRTIRLSSKMR